MNLLIVASSRGKNGRQNGYKNSIATILRDIDDIEGHLRAAAAQVIWSPSGGTYFLRRARSLRGLHPESKARSAFNGKLRQKGPRSVREIRRDIADLHVWLDAMEACRRQALEQ